MSPGTHSTPSPLAALMIAPDRALAEQFARTLAVTHAFQVLAELKSYPPHQVLDIRLRQLRPEVVLLDLVTSLEEAGELIRFIAETNPAIHVVGLHRINDSEAILRSLRLGASEFLCAPFDPAIQEQAVSRIRRLRGPQSPPQRELGKIVLFSSAKPGSGASTLAAQTAFALRQLTGKRVLLADMDLMGGTISFYLKLRPGGSVVDALGEGDSRWPAAITASTGLDVLAAPGAPYADFIEPARLHDFLERARQTYAWVILDLPAIFHRLSMLALSESDQAFLVSTAELPSLHLARKAATLLAQLGFNKDRFQLLINRVSRRDRLRGSDVSEIVKCTVYGSFPNDYFSLDRAVTLGEPLGGECELGRAIEDFAGRLAGVPAGERRKPTLLAGART